MHSTKQTPSSKPSAYFSELLQQDFILARNDTDQVVGFLSFKRDYVCPELESLGLSLYITTICVRKEWRRQGIMRDLYQVMEDQVTKSLQCPRISTRTWSTNQAQLHELKKRGYRELAVLKDDRGRGIDTIYFGLDVAGK